MVKETIGRGPDCGIVVLMCFLETTKDAVQRCGFLVGRLSVNEVLLQLKSHDSPDRRGRRKDSVGAERCSKCLGY